MMNLAKQIFDDNFGDQHPVRRLIVERAKTNSRPMRRYDNAKLGVVIEGGAMRGVVSAGMVSALELIGLRDVFDSVYGTSAGAFAGTYFIANQAVLGTSMFFEDLVSYEFINPFRILRDRPIVSMSYLIDDVMGIRKKLNFDAFLSSNIQMNVTLTDAANGNEEVIRHFHSKEDLMSCLRASSTMPILAGAASIFRNRLYFDGGLHHQIPIRLALKDECTHVLVLVPRSASWPEKTTAFSEQIAGTILKYWYCKELGYAQIERRKVIARELTSLREAVRKTDAPPYILPVFLDQGAKKITRMEKRPWVLVGGAVSGANAIAKTLGCNIAFTSGVATINR